MKELTRVRWKTLGWALFFLGSILVVIPMGFKFLFKEEGVVRWDTIAMIAIFIFAMGIALTVWSVDLFNRIGLGTPMPLDPPKHFVTEGPYRIMRNPLMAGVFLILLAEALFFRSKILLGYLGILSIIGNVWLIFFEEPELERRFGKAYREYKRKIPRWFPKLKRGSL